jgi:hypothetical protein
LLNAWLNGDDDWKKRVEYLGIYDSGMGNPVDKGNEDIWKAFH